MFQPMKGVAAPEDLTKIRYPVLASEKLDGWRSVIVPVGWARANIPCAPKHRKYFEAAKAGVVLSASNKPISNWFVQRQLDRPELVGLDGELIASDKFNETSSAFATYDGEPSFQFHIFDRWDRPNDHFAHRLHSLMLLHLPQLGDNIELRIHPHVEVSGADALATYLEEVLPPNAEGAITRDPKGLYKFGRATANQQWMLKIKAFEDDEAVVIGAEELMHNLNAPELNQLGHTQRSSHKEGKVGSGKLGALRCRPIGGGPDFYIGTGFDDSTRHRLWAQREDLFGRIVVYKKMKRGVLGAPRHPVFKGFRAEDYSA